MNALVQGTLQVLSSPKFQFWHDNAHSFDAMATWRLWPGRVETDGEVSAVRALAVSRDFLRVLGYTPSLGRDFRPAEDVPGGLRVAIISHAMWRTHFGSRFDVVGRTVRLDDKPVTIVGVLPESFAFPYEEDSLDLLVPLGLSVAPADVAENWPAIARLRDGVMYGQAQSDLASLVEPFRAAYPNQASAQDRGMTLATFAEFYVDERVRRELWILMGAVMLVLLISQVIDRLHRR